MWLMYSSSRQGSLLNKNTDLSLLFERFRNLRDVRHSTPTQVVKLLSERLRTSRRESSCTLIGMLFKSLRAKQRHRVELSKTCFGVNVARRSCTNLTIWLDFGEKSTLLWLLYDCSSAEEPPNRITVRDFVSFRLGIGIVVSPNTNEPWFLFGLALWSDSMSQSSSESLLSTSILNSTERYRWDGIEPLVNLVRLRSP